MRFQKNRKRRLLKLSWLSLGNFRDQFVRIVVKNSVLHVSCREHVNKHRVTTEAQRERYREIGKQNAAKHGSRSKNEIRFFELIQEKFPDALPNEPMFNGWDADIVIPSKKIAILWNGAWHYKDLLGGLKKIQNRDKIKYKEIVKKGYMPYIVVDFTSGKESTVQKELKRFEQFLQWL